MQVGNLKGCGLLIGIHMASSMKTAHITVVVYPAVGRTNFKKIVELCYVENIRIMKKNFVCVCVCAHMYLCIHNFILYRVLRNWHLHWSELWW